MVRVCIFTICILWLQTFLSSLIKHLICIRGYGIIEDFQLFIYLFICNNHRLDPWLYCYK